MNPPCLHKYANHQCGTKARYSHDGCRCPACKKAVSDYERNRVRQQAYGRWDKLIDAEPSRQHARRLMAEGMGWKRISDASGVPTGTLWKLLYGKRQPDGSLKPTKRVRRETASRILATQTQLADGARIDGTGTRRRLRALVAVGWSQSKLSRLMGRSVTNFTKVIHGDGDVEVLTARLVRDLYEQYWDREPPADTRHQRTARGRARNVARSYGWLPPMAWDDSLIDDPSYTPEVVAVSRLSKRDQVIELAELGFGLVEIACRLGVKTQSVEATLYRSGDLELRERLARSA